MANFWRTTRKWTQGIERASRNVNAALDTLELGHPDVRANIPSSQAVTSVVDEGSKAPSAMTIGVFAGAALLGIVAAIALSR